MPICNLLRLLRPSPNARPRSPHPHAGLPFSLQPMSHLLLVLLMAIVSASMVLAQSGAGAIQGTVSDSTGGVLANAAVHIVNVDTSVARDTVTNAAGFFTVPGLFAGNYEVSISAPGFKQSVQRISLQAAQNAVLNPTLGVGETSEKVEVVGESIQLATYDSGSVSSVLDAASISQIPENGRSVTNLFSTVTPDAFSNGGRPRLNGATWQATNLVQDGSTNVDLNFGGTLIAQPDIDSMQEVRVETSASNAKYSSPATAVITTKSGTNQFHGALFETAVNNAVGVARSRSNPSGFVQPHYVRNEFGGSVGGPILIPHFYDGHSKSFFFVAYERYSLRSGNYALGTVPTQAMRDGDFSGAINSNGVLQTIYDPNTTDATWKRQAFAGNKIDATRASALAKVMNAITPLPTNNSNPLVNNNIAYPALSNNTTPTLTFRLDHTFDPNSNAYVRFSSIKRDTVQTYASNQRAASVAGAGIPAGASNLVGEHQPEYTAALGFTHIFSPSLVSQTVLGGTWETEWYNMPPVGGQTNFEAKLGLPNNFGALGMPQVSGPIYPLTATQINWGGGEVILSAAEDLTKTHGKHQIYFGGRYGYTQIGTLPDRSADTVSFGSQGTGLYDPSTGANLGQTANTGHANADLYLGTASSYKVNLQPGYEHWRAMQFAAYIQDDFHITRKLTLNAGLRWEGMPAPIEINNLINGFDIKNKAVVLGTPISKLIADKRTTQGIITNLQNLGVVFETPQQAGLPEHIMHGNWNLFEPRLGFAYALSGSGQGTVFRAGAGRYAFQMPMRSIYFPGANNAPYSQGYTMSYTAGNQSPDGLNNYLLRSKPTVIAGQNSANVVDTSSISAITPGVREVVPNADTPPNMMWQINGTIEQPLRPSSVLRLSYIYNYSSNLDQEYSFNNAMSTYIWETNTGTAPPGGTYSSVALNPYDSKTYGTLISINPSGWATYNAVQANYQRLFKNGYGYQISYVFRKGMRVGGNGNRDTTLYPVGNYLPGQAPGGGDLHAMNRAQNYAVDSTFGPQSISWNGVIDLPVGRGKRFVGKANRLLNEIIGGYQLAYNGSAWLNWMSVNSGNWGGANPVNTGSTDKIKIYKHKHKVTDCSSGVCYPGYLWYNGFISPVLRNNPCTGTSQISGLPSDYQPYQTPINMDPGGYTCTNGTFKANNPHYLDNQVPVKLTNGTTVYTGYSPGPSTNAFSHTFLRTPWFWTTDISIFKVFPIKDGVGLRVNVDAFNAFNVQGDNAPNSNGIQYFTSSHNTPRQLQLSMRLNF